MSVCNLAIKVPIINHHTVALCSKWPSYVALHRCVCMQVVGSPLLVFECSGESTFLLLLVLWLAYLIVATTVYLWPDREKILLGLVTFFIQFSLEVLLSHLPKQVIKKTIRQIFNNIPVAPGEWTLFLHFSIFANCSERDSMQINPSPAFSCTTALGS